MKEKTKTKRYKVSLSIETIQVLKEVMADHLMDEPKSKWEKDYKRTISNLNTVINKYNKEIKENGHK